jgi:hypothetical protein
MRGTADHLSLVGSYTWFDRILSSEWEISIVYGNSQDYKEQSFPREGVNINEQVRNAQKLP